MRIRATELDLRPLCQLYGTNITSSATGLGLHYTSYISHQRPLVERPLLKPRTLFIPATTENIFVSTIFSGRHRDTLVDLAIVIFYQGHYKNFRLDCWAKRDINQI